MKKQNQHVGDQMFQLLRQYWVAGLSITTAIVLPLFPYGDFVTIILQGIYPAVVLVLLTLSTVIWFVSYVHATLHELMLLYKYNIVPAIPSSNWIPFALILFLAASFGVMIVNVTNPLIYTLVAIAFLMINVVGFTIVQISVARTSQTQKKTQSMEVIVEYYLFRPFVLHQMSVLCSFFVAFIFAGITKVQGNMSFATVSNIWAILTIFLCEFFVFRWRRSRDVKLASSE